MPYIDDPETLSQNLFSLELEVSTVDAGDAATIDPLFVNVVFTDGTRLYEPTNFLIPTIPVPLGPPIGPLPGRGDDPKKFELPVPAGLNRTLGEIAELFLRKPGDEGWFMGSALLFANGIHDRPLLGNRNANQFLDNNDDVLFLREWSTNSFCVAQVTDPKYPLLQSGYRLLGPVLGQLSDTSAVVLYRVDREGTYRFTAVDAITRAPVADVTIEMEPTGRFELTGLEPDRRYEFDLRFVRAEVESAVPGAAGSLRTYPPRDSPGVFSFAFGSCANPEGQAAQGAWTAIRSLAEAPRYDMVPVQLFVHLGDTFYFYDHMTEETVCNVESMHGAHVSMRRNIEFLDMARVVPCCGIWDDHDFASDNTDSTDISPELRSQAVETWMQYWGNNQPISERDHGLTTRISHGLVDVYLLDGRFHRDKENGVCFGNDLIADLLQMIDQRGAQLGRVVVLGTGSNWNHELQGAHNEYYGNPVYKEEREFLFSELANRMGQSINGLLLISGDDHINEIYRVQLGNGRTAPEFLSSPFTLNTDLSDPREIEGERVASFGTEEEDGKRGFATLEIDTSDAEGKWTAIVRYYQEAAAMHYESCSYKLENGEFILA